MNYKKQETQVYQELSRERVLEQGMIYVDKVRAKFHGEINDFVVMSIGDGVGVVPITDKNTTILVREYRIGAQEFQWNFPGGGRNKKESIEETARREFKEETNGEITKLEYLGKFNSVPAFLEGELHYFIGWGAKVPPKTPQSIISKEIDTWREFTFNEAIQLVKQGLMPHTGSITALFLTLEQYPWLREEKPVKR